ncbi:hypothetical protein GC175_05865 [bacterium]|nr:hypothetical protein [bacterium]
MDLKTKRTLLLFNPNAGANREEPMDLVGIIREMQRWDLVPLVFLIEEDCDLPRAVDDALADGIDLFVVCGGDGTISAVAGALAHANATLGIIAGGTRNNIVLSLGLPETVAEAVALLRNGRPRAVDMGQLTLLTAEGYTKIRPFLEVCSIGLGSALFSPADDVQHGDLSRIGDLLSTLITSPTAEFTLLLDEKQDQFASGHAILVVNMPYSGHNYPMGAEVAFDDKLLDVLVFADLTKLELVAHALRKGDQTETLEDPRIQRYQVRHVEIDTTPVMPVMVDGNVIGEGKVRIEVAPHQLTIMLAPTLQAGEL